MANSANERAMAWATVDVSTLPKSFQDLHAKVTAARKVANEATKAFEDAYRKGLEGQVPEGKEVVFSWKFGKLSLAVTDPKAKGTSGKVTTFLPK